MISDQQLLRISNILFFARTVTLAGLLLFSVSLAGGQPKAMAAEPFKLCSSYILETGTIITAVGNQRGVFVAESGGMIRLLHPTSLNTIWSAEIGGNIVSNLVLAGDFLYVSANTASDAPISKLRAINVDTGLIHSSYDLEFSKSFQLRKAGDRLLIVPEAAAPQLLNGSDLRENGRFDLWSSGDRVLFANAERMLVVSGTNVLRVVSLTDMSNRPQIQGNDRVFASAYITSDGRLITGNGTGEIRSERLAANGRTWKFKTGGEIVLMDSIDGNVLIASNDNFLYLLGGQNGSVIWRSRLPGRPSTGKVLQDAGVAIGVLGEERIFIIDSSNGKVQNLIQLEENEEIRPDGIHETQPGSFALLTTRGLRAYSSAANCGRNE